MPLARRAANLADVLLSRFRRHRFLSHLRSLTGYDEPEILPSQNPSICLAIADGEQLIPSLRQSSAMLTSPRRPSSTMRIFSSAECCRRVALRISRTVFSALSGMRLLACLIVAPQQGYDEPKILSYAISPFCPTSADGLQLAT